MEKKQRSVSPQNEDASLFSPDISRHAGYDFGGLPPCTYYALAKA